MLKIDLSRASKKFLKRLPPKQGRQIAVKITELLKNSRPHDSIKMKGKACDYHRVDVGEYRVIYQVEANTLKVALVGKRNDDQVYKEFKRKL